MTQRWRVHDYADGWIYYSSEEEARESEEAKNGCLVEPAPPQARENATEVLKQLSDVKALLLEHGTYHSGVDIAATTIARLEKDRAGLVEALFEGASWFDEYADGHEKKGAMDKALRNAKRANALRAAALAGEGNRKCAKCGKIIADSNDANASAYMKGYWWHNDCLPAALAGKPK